MINKIVVKKMKRLLLPLLAAIALPIAINANLFGAKTFYLICDTSEYNVFLNGANLFGGWQESTKSDYGLFTLNEKNKTASLSIFKNENNIIYSGLDVVFFNKDSIKLSRKYKYDGEDNIITYTINRINGDFNFRIDDIDPSDTYTLNRGSCRESDRKLF